MRRQEYQPEGLHAPISHYCDAVRWGDLLFISGLTPLDRDMKLVSMKVEVEAVVGLR